MMAVVAVIEARPCSGGARHGAHAPANRRTDTGTVATSRVAPIKGSANAVVANNSPAQIAPAIVDCFPMSPTCDATEETTKPACSSLVTALPSCDRHFSREATTDIANGNFERVCSVAHSTIGDVNEGSKSE